MASDAFSEFFDSSNNENPNNNLDNFLAGPLIPVRILVHLAKQLDEVNRRRRKGDVNKPDSVFKAGDNLLEKLLQMGLVINLDGTIARAGGDFNIKLADIVVFYLHKFISQHDDEECIVLPFSPSAYSNLPNGIALGNNTPCTALITYFNRDNQITQERIPVRYDRNFTDGNIAIPRSLEIYNDSSIFLSTIELDITAADIDNISNFPQSSYVAFGEMVTRSKALPINNLYLMGSKYRHDQPEIPKLNFRNGINVETIQANPYDFWYEVNPSDISVIDSIKDIIVIPTDINLGMSVARIFQEIPEYDVKNASLYGRPLFTVIESRDENGIRSQKRVPAVRVAGHEGSRLLVSSKIINEAGGNFKLTFEAPQQGFHTEG